jgi:hypothetical protein
MNQQSTEVTGVTDKTGTGAVEDRTVGDADTAEGLTAADNTDDGFTSPGDGRAADEARLLERGVELHALSADEEEGDDSEEEMDGRDLTPEEAAAATRSCMRMTMIRKDSFLPAVIGLIQLSR